MSGVGEGRRWVHEGPKTVEKESVENLENNVHCDWGIGVPQGHSKGVALN